jgi:hypothetical protein
MDRRFSAMSQRARVAMLAADLTIFVLMPCFHCCAHYIALSAAAAPFNVQSSIWVRRSLRGGSGAGLAQHKPLFCRSRTR